MGNGITIDVRNQRITLSAPNGRRVEIVADGKHGPFAHGPISWEMFEKVYLQPALYALELQPHLHDVDRTETCWCGAEVGAPHNVLVR